MEYVELTLIPRGKGWYGALSIKDTTRTRHGRPQPTGVWPFEFTGLSDTTAAHIAVAVRKALDALADDRARSAPKGRPHTAPPLF